MAATDPFTKTGNDDVVTLTRELSAGTYTFKLHNSGTDKWYGKDDTTVNDTVNRLTVTASGGDITLAATGGTYEFKYELSTYKLSVYHADNNAMAEMPTVVPGAEYMVGDANDNKGVDIGDATAIQYHLAEFVKLNGISLKAADANLDKELDIRDATAIQKFLAGFEQPYPIGEILRDNDSSAQPATQSANASPTEIKAIPHNSGVRIAQ